MHTLISTWEFSFRGAGKGLALLKDGGCAGDAVTTVITDVEDDPDYKSVGYGALPGRDGRLTTDAAYMDGNVLRFGAIMSAEHIKNPILAAQKLCGRELNYQLAGKGAEDFAVAQGLEMRDMRTPQAMERWKKALGVEAEKANDDSHDTVCVLALDDEGRMIAGTSTSGLFMKEPGRVGDTPIVGSGFYCDARYGAAAATGTGEEIMRGCLSYEIVSQMKNGADATTACRRAVDGLCERLTQLGHPIGDISVIALKADGTYGAGTTRECFPFVAGHETATLYATEKSTGKIWETSSSEIQRSKQK